MNFPDTIYTLDLVFVGVVLIFGISGLRRGLSGEMAHVLTLVVMLCGLCFFYPSLTQASARHWEEVSPLLIQVVVGLAMFLVGAVLFFAMRALLRRLLKARVGEATDKVLGTLMGLVRGFLIGLVCFALLSLLPSERVYSLLSQKSVVGGWVCGTLTPWAHPKLMELPLFNHQEN